MRTSSFASKLGFLISVLFVAACAERENPIALQAVQPDEEVASRIGSQRLSGPLTLYTAVTTQGVPSKVAKKAFEKYDEFEPQVRNKAYIVMVDFTQHSKNKRFYMVNRSTGKVDQWSVAHGSGSDPDNDGMAQYFSNVPDSHMSSLGSYLIQEKYVGKFGESLRLDGLESTNSNVRDRAIVLHPSNYVKDGLSKQGRSWGCPAIPYDWIKTVIARTVDGTFMYAYGINKRSARADIRALQQWDMVPRHLWTNEGEDAPLWGE